MTTSVPKKLPTPGSLPSTGATTSKGQEVDEFKHPKKKCIEYFYNKETGEFLGRTCRSWLAMTIYSIMYLLFLATFTLIILYASLQVIKQLIDFKNTETIDFLRYPEHGIGLTATPTSENNYPLIWYKNGYKEDYEKYVQALDKLIAKNRRKRELNILGPCGESPYGYGEQPCIILRINKRYQWHGLPLQPNSTIWKSAPVEVQKWITADNSKLWLRCSGYHPYDKEHLGTITYYPNPPGFEAGIFPLEKDKQSPLVAIQISGFTIGISLAVECTLWYDSGPSTVDFVLYVAPEDRTVNITQTSVNF